ncbi:MAG: MBL fold metallo-hydrolase [Candidatus Binatia bacterium]
MRPAVVRRGSWCVLLALCCLSGCEQDLRVPYIPPKLANWPQPYRGISGLTVHVFNTGYVRVSEALILRGGSLTEHRDLPVPAFVIQHPRHGLILFNTGLSPKPDQASPWRGWLRLIAPEVSAGHGLKAQMAHAGLKAGAVKWIVLSNMRFDHTGEVKAFPNARVVVAKAEYDYAQGRRDGYASQTFDGVANWKFIDFRSAKPLGTFLAHVDLFGDGSCLLLEASGSTPGTMAMLARLRQGPLLLADDLAAVAESLRYAAKPASVYDMGRWWDHIWRLKRFKDLVPNLIVLPGHAREPILAARSKQIIVHDFRPPAGRLSPAPTPNRLRRLIPQPW